MFDDDGGISTMLVDDELCLLVDADIVIYQPCCIFNDDHDKDRAMIAKTINNKIDKLMAEAGCATYIMFVTTKKNFRDHLVDDYKANRADVERPVNLAWAKRWAVENMNTHYVPYLEADDLLGIYQTDKTVIWSLDKDLMQIAGKHLVEKPDPDDPKKVVYTMVDVPRIGTLIQHTYFTESGNKKVKYLFSGAKGLYFQMLIGDNTDYILGCAKRVPAMRMGKPIKKRKGVGAVAAYKIISRCKSVKDLKNAVGGQYFKIYPKDWQKHWEIQSNLLFMVREADGNIIKRWTYDGRDEYMDIVTGEIFHDHNKKGEDAT